MKLGLKLTKSAIMTGIGLLIVGIGEIIQDFAEEAHEEERKAEYRQIAREEAESVYDSHK